jgi:hypothetical protein
MPDDVYPALVAGVELDEVVSPAVPKYLFDYGYGSSSLSNSRRP